MKSPLILAMSVFLSSPFALAARPPMDVTVFDSGERVVHRAKTAADGTFATPKLSPGNYVVQFNSDARAGEQYALVVSAGKKKVVADSVAGEKFGGGGVAMRVEVGRGLNIVGQVAPAAMAAEIGASNTKIVNGRRYVRVAMETGSNITGRWEEEGIGGRHNVVQIRWDDVRNLQERGYDMSRR